MPPAKRTSETCGGRPHRRGETQFANPHSHIDRQLNSPASLAGDAISRHIQRNTLIDSRSVEPKDRKSEKKEVRVIQSVV